MDGERRVRPLLSPPDCATLVRTGAATGGMQAKLDAAVAALAQGVGQVRIAPGATGGVLNRLLAGEAIGTRLVSGREEAA